MKGRCRLFMLLYVAPFHFSLLYSTLLGDYNSLRYLLCLGWYLHCFKLSAAKDILGHIETHLWLMGTALITDQIYTEVPGPSSIINSILCLALWLEHSRHPTNVAGNKGRNKRQSHQASWLLHSSVNLLPGLWTDRPKSSTRRRTGHSKMFKNVSTAAPPTPHLC